MTINETEPKQTIELNHAVWAINFVIDRFKEESKNVHLNTILDLVRSQILVKLFQKKDYEDYYKKEGGISQ